MSVVLVVTSYGSNMDGLSVECLRIKVMDIFLRDVTHNATVHGNDSVLH